jgi:hypothetical protein
MSVRDWAGLKLPTGLARFLPGSPCYLHVRPDVLANYSSDASGGIKVRLAIPNISGLVGQDAFFQWLVNDPGTSGGMASTEAIGLEIQRDKKSPDVEVMWFPGQSKPAPLAPKVYPLTKTRTALEIFLCNPYDNGDGRVNVDSISPYEMKIVFDGWNARIEGDAAIGHSNVRREHIKIDGTGTTDLTLRIHGASWDAVLNHKDFNRKDKPNPSGVLRAYVNVRWIEPGKLVERAGIIFKTGVNQPVKNGGTTRTFVLKNIPRGVPLRIMVRCQGSITVDAKHQTDATFKFAYTSLEMVK